MKEVSFFEGQGFDLYIKIENFDVSDFAFSNLQLKVSVTANKTWEFKSDNSGDYVLEKISSDTFKAHFKGSYTRGRVGRSGTSYLAQLAVFNTGDDHTPFKAFPVRIDAAVNVQNPVVDGEENASGESQLVTIKYVSPANQTIEVVSVVLSQQFVDAIQEVKDSAIETIEGVKATAIEQIEELIDDAEAEKTAAVTARNQAEGFATSANTSKNTATTKAGEALTSANNAHTSEQNAAGSATDANTSKNTAATKAGEALTSANNAHTSEVNAANSEANALTYAQNVQSAVVTQGDWNASTNTPALSANSSGYIANSYFKVTVAGVSTFAGTNFSVGQAFSIGDELRKINNQWFRVPYSDVAFQRANAAQVTNVFQGTVDTVVPLSAFLLDIQFTGLTANATDQIYVENVRRAKHYTSPSVFDRWLLRIAKNGTNICTFFVDGYTEPVADAGGKRIATITLPQEGSSGISAVAIVDWSALPTNSETIYTDSTARLKSLLSPKKYLNPSFVEQRTQNLTTGGKLASTNVTIGSAGDIATELARMDITRLFKGPEVNSQLSKFLLDIQFTGLTVPAASSQVHLYNVWRNYPNPTTPRWVVDIAVYSGGTSTRFVQFVQDNYTEPTPDANGNIIETITLPAFGGSGVSATAKVNWAALTPGVQNIFAGSTRVNSLLSEKAYMPTLPVAVDNTKVDRIDVNNLLSGTAHDAFLKDFLVDIVFDQDISPATGQTVHLLNVWRNYPNPGNSNIPRWAIDVAINDTRFVFWGANNYTEPSADANGNIFDTITLSEISGSGKSGKIKVNWAKLTSGVSNAYSGSNRAKGALSPNAYNRRRLTPLVTNTKANLPTTAVPNRVYTILNDIDPRNVFTTASVRQQDLVRNYALTLYVDHFLKNFPLNTDVRWDKTKSDKIRVYSPRKGDLNPGTTVERTTDHAFPSEIIARSFVINGGTNYNNRTINFNQVSVRASAAANALIVYLELGDSTTFGLQMEVGVLDGFAHRSYGVMHEQAVKDKIDYLLAQNYTASQIMAGSISPADAAKYRMFCVGTVTDPTGVETYNINYRGVQANYTLRAEGRGGWNINAYLNKPTLMVRGQGTWDTLGLGNGSGSDWTGSAAQKELFDRTAFNANNIIDSPAMRAWFASALGYTTGTSLADFKTRGQTLANNPANPFYDDAKSATVTDSLGNTWAVKFSIDKYLSRYRTMDDNGVRLGNSDPAKGTLVVNTTDYDVFRPTHVGVQSCQNDQDVDHYGRLAKALGDAVKAEYVLKGWGTVNVAISIVDGSGTYFPNLYPEISDCELDEFQRNVHDNNLQRALTEIVNEDTNRIYVLANTFILPTAQAVIWRAGNSPEYELTGDYRDVNKIPSRTSVGVKSHINAIANRPAGLNKRGWTLHTL